MPEQTKKIIIDTLPLRSRVLETVFESNTNILNLPSWDGFNANKYMARKDVRDFMHNKLKEIVVDESVKIVTLNGGRDVRMHVSANKDIFDYIQKLSVAGLTAYVK